ncbi:hypothetical protein [Vibrio sp. ER1A]|uniref:hypothetical protein n=1 Tax=Vibrio sp. ER1A TaxID=1517681 RepID=UPI0004DCEB8F|nr:hypothetical protein [Vibrio sp. ER1A]KFA97563.1 hypothetical protein HW45_09145 [Vibrio sp. ER1A]
MIKVNIEREMPVSHSLKVMVEKELPLGNTIVAANDETVSVETSSNNVYVLPAVGIYDAQVNADKIEVQQLTQEVREAHTHIHADKAEVGVLKQDVITLKDQTNTIKNETNAIKSQTQTLKNETNTLTVEVRAAHTHIHADKAIVAADKANVQSNKNATQTLKNEVNTLTVEVRETHEHIHADKANVQSNKEVVDSKHADVVSKHSDTTTKHSQVNTWNSNVNTKHADTVAKHSDIVAKHTDVSDWSDNVNAKHDVVVNRHDDVVNRHGNITSRHTDITTKHTEVEKDRAEVEANTSTVAADKATVIANKNEVIAAKNETKTSETNALASKNAAKVSETNSKTSETNAASSASKALASERNAKASEENASESATRAETAAAAMTGAMTEMGNCDLSSGKYPAPFEDVNGNKRSCFWKVIKGGTVNGIPYGVGDSLVYSVTLEDYYKIDNTESVTSVDGMQGVVNLESKYVRKSGDVMTDKLIIRHPSSTSFNGLSIETGGDGWSWINFGSGGATTTGAESCHVAWKNTAEGSIPANSLHLRPGGKGTGFSLDATTVRSHRPLSLDHAPTGSSHATRKDYVDAEDNKRVSKAGDTMTSALRVTGTTAGNTVPAAEQIKLDAYGLIGNRGLVYLTNGSTAADAGIQLGVGGVHNASGNSKLTLTKTLLTSSVPLEVQSRAAITTDGGRGAIKVRYGTEGWRTAILAQAADNLVIGNPSAWNNITLEGKKLRFNDGTIREVYHEGHKPTAAEVGAIPTTGGEVSGRLSSTGLRVKRSSGAGTGDDVLDIKVDDSHVEYVLDNRNDAGASTHKWMYYASKATAPSNIFSANHDGLTIDRYKVTGPSGFNRQIYLNAPGHTYIAGKKTGIGFHDNNNIYFMGGMTDGSGGAYLANMSSTEFVMQGALRSNATTASLVLNSTTDVEGKMSKIEFKTPSNQNVRLRNNGHDNTRAPFGLHIEKGDGNSSTADKAYLDVEGDIFSQGIRVMRQNDTIDKAKWADTVDINTSTSASYYGVVWHSGDTVYASENQGFTVRPSDGHVKIKHVHFGDNLAVNNDGTVNPVNTDKRAAGMYGVYDSKRIGHIWSMGTAYKIPADGANFGTLYGFAYKHTNNTTGGTMAGGHQAVWCTNGVPQAALGDDGIWSSNATTTEGYFQVGRYNKSTDSVIIRKPDSTSWGADKNAAIDIGGAQTSGSTATYLIRYTDAANARLFAIDTLDQSGQTRFWVGKSSKYIDFLTDGSITNTGNFNLGGVMDLGTF